MVLDIHVCQIVVAASPCCSALAAEKLGRAGAASQLHLTVIRPFCNSWVDYLQLAISGSHTAAHITGLCYENVDCTIARAANGGTGSRPYT